MGELHFICLSSLSRLSKSFPLFNRCIPQTPEGYSLFASVLVNDVDTLHRILRGIMSGRDTILGLCILSLGLSLAMVFTFRFITTLLVHTFIALVIWGLLFVCGVLWWLYYDYTNDFSIALDTETENMTCLLGFAVVSTVLTAVLLVLIFVLRKKKKLAVELLWVTNKAISSSPFLLFQPLWTCAILVLLWVLWVAVPLSLGTAGAAQVIEGGRVEYKPLSGIWYVWWYHLIGLIWTSEFSLTCQQMTVAGAVVTSYFNSSGVHGQGTCSDVASAVSAVLTNACAISTRMHILPRPLMGQTFVHQRKMHSNSYRRIQVISHLLTALETS